MVDRIKNMFKLAQGEYIAAEHLENKYTCVQAPVVASHVRDMSCAALPVQVQRLQACALRHSVLAGLWVCAAVPQRIETRPCHLCARVSCMMSMHQASVWLEATPWTFPTGQRSPLNGSVREMPESL